MSKNDSPEKTPEEEGLYDAEAPPSKEAGKGPQILVDSGPEASEEKEREIAFNQGPIVWNGKPLREWSSSREAYWLEMRHALGARHLSECILGSYTFLPDAFRILFLSYETPEVLMALRDDPVRFQTAVDQWVDNHVPIERHDEATTKAMRIYNLGHKNHAEAAPSDLPDHGDDSGN